MVDFDIYVTIYQSCSHSRSNGSSCNADPKYIFGSSLHISPCFRPSFALPGTRASYALHTVTSIDSIGLSNGIVFSTFGKSNICIFVFYCLGYKDGGFVNDGVERFKQRGRGGKGLFPGGRTSCGKGGVTAYVWVKEDIGCGLTSIAAYPSGELVVHPTGPTSYYRYIAVAVMIPSLFDSFDDSVASFPFFRSELPMNSSTDVDLKFSAATQTVTAHYYYPPSGYYKGYLLQYVVTVHSVTISAQHLHSITKVPV